MKYQIPLQSAKAQSINKFERISDPSRTLSPLSQTAVSTTVRTRGRRWSEMHTLFEVVNSLCALATLRLIF